MTESGEHQVHEIAIFIAGKSPRWTEKSAGELSEALSDVAIFKPNFTSEAPFACGKAPLSRKTEGAPAHSQRTGGEDGGRVGANESSGIP